MTLTQYKGAARLCSLLGAGSEAHGLSENKFLEALLGQVVELHFEGERLLGYGLSIKEMTYMYWIN